MAVDRQWVRTYLKQFDFESLFIEELGWDQVDLDEIPVGLEGAPYVARAIAQKRGMVVYHCKPETGDTLPDNGTRRKIDNQITQYSREHLIVYSDTAQREQIWQWVRREKGKPQSVKEYSYHIEQDGESMVQRLTALAIDLDEEEDLTTVDVKKRSKKAFDVDKVTKKFYKRFQQEHQRFLDFVMGIAGKFDREWYASVMINRLMFVYFLQKKGFLDGDFDYLRNRLSVCQRAQGDDEFYSFYRYFLLRLFHEGLGDSKRDDAELEQLIGKIPYLNGGLFDVHELEERNPDIQIPDEAFESIFDFFDDYQWHLDDRPLQNDKEINPDVLGYIFEQYINNKQMGAYYTKEDITEYISKNTIIPFLFDAAKKGCAVAFEPSGPVWQLLKENPERYIYDAMKKGVIKADPKAKTTEVIALPDEIAAGIEDVSKRDGWNRLADAEYGLPTELWREHVARRQRCLEVRETLTNGEVHEINDLITYNLDIRQFAQDVIEQCEGPELLRAFYKAISQISVLDPTCGSGAFLFAALNILEPMYGACLQRMTGFVADIDRSGKKAHPEKFSDFRKNLEQVSKHPNREYFVLKSIILGNLYGVDIMEEAVEICKLRLFLKLVSQAEAKAEKPNYGLEPLPDIDFNIRAGNTLVGFANYDEVRKAVEGDGQQKLDLFSDMPRIDEDAEVADKQFQMFRFMQNQHDMDASQFKDAKVKVRKRLKSLNNELNRYLSNEHGVTANKSEMFEKWLKSHQPFHWFVEFYRIVKEGGFDVIVGNPPYVEYSKIRKRYSLLESFNTIACGNLYAPVLERAYQLQHMNSRSGFIIPLSMTCTKRMEQLRILQRKQSVWSSCYDMRPSSLFEGVAQRLCILLGSYSIREKIAEFHTGGYRRWKAPERPSLLSTVGYTKFGFPQYDNLPKLKDDIEAEILAKLSGPSIQNLCDSLSKPIFVHRIVRYFVKAFDFVPSFIDANGNAGKSDDYKPFKFVESQSKTINAMLNSSTFYWFWRLHSDGFHCGYNDVFLLPYDGGMESSVQEKLSKLNQMLMTAFQKSSVEKTISTKAGEISYQEFSPKQSISIINKIDAVIAEHYGFSQEELDFILNYDIKYRMGLDSFKNN